MTIESDIFDGVVPDVDTMHGFGDFKLLKTTAYASLYVAVKSGKRFLLKTTKDKSEWQERLLHREYEIALGMEHPHIAHVYTMESIEPLGVAIVMEYIDGRTLGDYLAERPSRKERQRILDELFKAVEYMHKRGVVHNDIKPDNILISNVSDTLKLIDFGLADSDAEYAMRTLGCTPRYASAELRARKAVDARSDIYSLGVIMGEMFGRSHVVRRATSGTPQRRYANVAELRKAWQRRYIAWVVLLAAIVVVVVVTLYLSRPTMSDTAPNDGGGIVLRDTTYVVVDSLPSETIAPLSEPLSAPSQSNVDILLHDLEVGMEQIYRVAAEGIATTKYREFCTQYCVDFWSDNDSLSTALIAKAKGAQERAQISARHEYLKHHYFTKLSEQLNAVPSTITLDGDERLFYLSLLEEDLPFREYKAEE